MNKADECFEEEPVSANAARADERSATRTDDATVISLVGRRLLKSLQDGPLTRSELMRAVGTDISEIERTLESMREQGLVAISGFGSCGEFGLTPPKWSLTDKGRGGLYVVAPDLS